MSGGRLSHAVSGLFENYQRRALFLLFAALALDQADRTLIGALGPQLKQVFGIGNFQLGLLSSLFLFVGAVAAIPLGILVDRRNRTFLLAGSFIVWSIAIGFVGASVTFLMILVSRLALGLVSATYGPATPSLVGDLVPAGQRGKALGLTSAGTLIGLGLGYAVPGVITAFTSWRLCFWVLAIAGFFLAVGFFRLKKPERGGTESGSGAQEQRSRMQQMVKQRNIRPDERAMFRWSPARANEWEAVKYTVRVRTDLIALVARSIGDFFLQGLATFVIVFVIGWYGISQGQAYVDIFIVGIGAIAGVLVLSRISDALLARGFLNSRVWVGSLGYILGAVAFFPAFITNSLSTAIPLYAVGAFFFAGARPPVDALRVDVLVGKMRGRAESIRQALRSVFEGFAPVVIGGLSAVLGGGSGGLHLAFLIVLPLLILNGVILLFALRSYQPDVAAAIASAEEEEKHTPR